jgi:hypothetical protein
VIRRRLSVHHIEYGVFPLRIIECYHLDALEVLSEFLPLDHLKHAPSYVSSFSSFLDQVDYLLLVDL